MNSFFKKLFILILCFSFLQSFAYGAVNIKKRKGWWLLRKDIKVTLVKSDEEGVTVKFKLKNGKIITSRPSDLKRAYGDWATYLLWKKLNESDRLKLIRSYGFKSLLSARTFKKNAEKDFGYKTLTDMMKFGVNHIFYVKMTKEILKGAALSRVKIPPEVDEARKIVITGLPRFAYGIDISKEPGFKKAEKLKEKIKEEMKAVQELSMIMTNLELKKIFKVFESVTSFTFEQVLSLITGGIYKATQEMSNLTAEIIKQIYNGVSNSLNTNMTADKFIKFCNNLQQAYYTHLKKLATKLKKHKEKYKNLVDQLMRTASNKALKNSEEEEKKLTKKIQILSKQASIKHVFVKNQKSNKLSKKQIEQMKAISAALQAKINQLCTVKRLFLSSVTKKWEEDKNVKKYKINKDSIDNSIKAFYIEIGYNPTVSYIKENIFIIKKEIPNIKAVQQLANELAYKISYEVNQLPYSLKSIQSSIIKWEAKGIPISVDTSCVFSMIKNMTRKSFYFKEISENLSALLNNLYKTKQSLHVMLSKRKKYLKKIQSHWQTLADNYLYSYDALLKIDNEYNDLLSKLGILSMFNRSGWGYWEHPWFTPYSNQTKKAFKMGDLQNVKHIYTKIQQDVEKIEKIYHRAAVAYNYTIDRREKLNHFVYHSPAGEINLAIKNKILSGPEIIDAYTLRNRLGRPKRAENIYNELKNKKISVSSIAELGLIIDMIEDYNNKVQANIKSIFSNLKKITSQNTYKKLVWESPDKYNMHIKTVNLLWSQVSLNCSPYNSYSMDIAKNVPVLKYWISPLQSASFPTFDLRTKETRKVCKDASLFYKKWIKMLSKVEKQRKRLAYTPAIIPTDRIKINGRLFTGPYANVVLNKQQLTNGKIIISGIVISGYPVDTVEISGDIHGIATIKGNSIKKNNSITKWEFSFIPKRNTYRLTIMPKRQYMELHSSQGPDISITIINTGNYINEETKIVRHMYSDFANQYMAKNISSLMQYISQDWSAYDGTNIDDLEEILENSFDIFDRIEYKISNLKIKSIGKNHFRVSYDNKITGYIYSERITHKEGGHVVEEVVIKDGKPMIIKTISGHFWRVSR